MTELSFDDILRLLPHRYPILLIDRVLECDEENRRIRGLKNLTFNEPFFQGHFPGRPIMPGVLQLEAMAQLGGILLNLIRPVEGQVPLFLSIDNARFRKPAVPGDQLLLEVEFQRIRMGMAKVHGRATVDGDLVSEADLMFGSGKE
jgi:beta-hydroxyacyl-ACP dehydratase FabZ